MIQTFDDLLSEKEKNHIENFLRDNKFSWFLSGGFRHYTIDEETYHKNDTDERGEFVMLCHVFYLDTFRNSPNYQLSDFILDRFLERTGTRLSKLWRSKANLQLKCNTDKLHTTPHTDRNEEHKVLIYYANDSDGDTFFFDNGLKIIERVPPKQGRFVLFDGDILHAAGFNNIYDIRLNINFNFI
jgi:hypothetical protein